MYSVTLTPVPTPPISKSCPRPVMHTLHHMYHQMNAELFPDADPEANPEGYNHALLNATMQTVRVALQDDVINVYRVRHTLLCMMRVMCHLLSNPLHSLPLTGWIEAAFAVIEFLSTQAPDQ